MNGIRVKQGGLEYLNYMVSRSSYLGRVKIATKYCYKIMKTKLKQV